MTPAQVLDRAGLDRLIGALSARGYRVLGPTVRDGAIVYGDLSATADLPVGWTDRQEAAKYRLVRRDDDALFGYVVGPQSPKTNLHPADVVVWAGDRTAQGFAMAAPAGAAPLRLLRGAALRAGGHRHPGPGLPGGRARRDLRRPPRRRLPGGGELHRTGRHLLLRLHGHRPGRHGGLRHRPDRGPRRRRTTTSRPRPARSGGRRCSPPPAPPRPRRGRSRRPPTWSRPPPGAWDAPWRPPAWPTCCARAWSIPTGRRSPSAV